MTLRDDALKLHLENHGKLAVVSKVPIKTREDLALAYTPGVAEHVKKSKKIKTCPLNIHAAAIWSL